MYTTSYLPHDAFLLGLVGNPGNFPGPTGVRVEGQATVQL